MGQSTVQFEKNSVGTLLKRLANASDKEIDRILEEYSVPSPGEFDKPGSYIQTTSPQAQREKRKANDIVFVPLGSTEVHGPHSVPGQDLFQTMRIGEAIRRRTSKLGREANLAYSPWIYAWHPYHHLGMPGTIPVSGTVVIHQLVDVMFGLWTAGYRKQIFLNNHAGISLIVQAINEFRCRYPQLPIVAMAVDWCVAVKDFLRTKDQGGEFETHFIHADEIETSIGLVLCPEMLNMKLAVDTTSKGYLPDGHFDKSADTLDRPNKWFANVGLVPQEINEFPVGVVGKATLADPKKAKRAVAAILEYLTLLNDDILERFPPGKLPPIEETTLFSRQEIEAYTKDPSEPGYKNPYRLWNPFC
jgi:creatinine amidohydrolase/Fe(II)-dependent formamide hydrolase-like protein